MVEATGGTGLALEAVQAALVATQFLRKNLDRDVASEAGIAGR